MASSVGRIARLEVEVANPLKIEPEITFQRQLGHWATGPLGHWADEGSLVPSKHNHNIGLPPSRASNLDGPGPWSPGRPAVTGWCPADWSVAGYPMTGTGQTRATRTPTRRTLVRLELRELLAGQGASCGQGGAL
ncbi:hypothetical protein E4U54_003467, partial [Claviceps lovelessii]